MKTPHTHPLSAYCTVCLWSAALCCSWGKIITEHHTDLQYGRVQLLWGETHTHTGEVLQTYRCFFGPLMDIQGAESAGWYRRGLTGLRGLGPCPTWSRSVPVIQPVSCTMWDIIDSDHQIIYLCKQLATVPTKTKISSDETDVLKSLSSCL